MAFKLRSGNTTTFKQMGSSPVKVAGIFVGEGEDRVRIGSKEAAEREAQGETITRTAADNPNIKEGKQQIKNLGETYAEIDAELQDTAEGKETLDPSQYNYRRTQDPNEMVRMMSDGPVTTKDAEKTIREYENVEGKDPMVTGGEITKYYLVNGNKLTEDEYKKYKKNKKTKTTTVTRSGPNIKGDPYSKENQAKLREYYRSQNR